MLEDPLVPLSLVSFPFAKQQKKVEDFCNISSADVKKPT